MVKGYLEVYDRQFKGTTGEGYAIRQAVESSFFDLLEERNGMVGEVYILGADAKLYVGTGDRDNFEPNENNKVQFAKSDIQTKINDKVGFIQVAGKEWDTTHEYEDGIKTKKTTNVGTTSAILNSAATPGNAGVYTVVRYFIKKDELAKLVRDNGLQSYTFRTSFLRQNENKYGVGNTVNGYTDYKFTNNKERDLKRGQKINFRFDQAQYNRRATTYVTKPELTIGSENYNISFRDSMEYDRDGLTVTWTVPFDIKVKADEEIKLTSLDYDENKRATRCVMTIANGELLTAKGKVNYNPIEMVNSASLTGGVLVSTIEKPNVDGIFTDSDKITGHSFYNGAEVNIYHFNEGEKVKQTLSAAGNETGKDNFDYSTIMTKAKYVNGQEVDAFPFDTTKPNNGGAIQGDKKHEDFVMPTLERDMPIMVDNLDVASSFIDSKAVIEQEQTKFPFDLNGQTYKKNK